MVAGEVRLPHADAPVLHTHTVGFSLLAFSMCAKGSPTPHHTDPPGSPGVKKRANRERTPAAVRGARRWLRGRDGALAAACAPPTPIERSGAGVGLPSKNKVNAKQKNRETETHIPFKGNDCVPCKIWRTLTGVWR